MSIGGPPYHALGPSAENTRKFAESMTKTNDRLKEIRDVLLEARQTTDYDIGSPRALDHLLRHVVALIDALLPEVKP